MRNSFRIGSILGISIFVHVTWLVVFALVTFSLVGHFAASFPALSYSVQSCG